MMLLPLLGLAATAMAASTTTSCVTQMASTSTSNVKTYSETETTTNTVTITKTTTPVTTVTPTSRTITSNVQTTTTITKDARQQTDTFTSTSTSTSVSSVFQTAYFTATEYSTSSIFTTQTVTIDSPSGFTPLVDQLASQSAIGTWIQGNEDAAAASSDTPSSSTPTPTVTPHAERRRGFGGSRIARVPDAVVEKRQESSTPDPSPAYVPCDKIVIKSTTSTVSATKTPAKTVTAARGTVTVTSTVTKKTTTTLTPTHATSTVTAFTSTVTTITVLTSTTSTTAIGTTTTVYGPQQTYYHVCDNNNMVNSINRLGVATYTYPDVFPIKLFETDSPVDCCVTALSGGYNYGTFWNGRECYTWNLDGRDCKAAGVQNSTEFEFTTQTGATELQLVLSNGLCGYMDYLGNTGSPNAVAY